MVQLFHVSKHYDRRTALSDITLEIEKGEFMLLMGRERGRKIDAAEAVDRGGTTG